MRKKPLFRDWGEVRKKAEMEHECRVCGSTTNLEAAHTIGRKYQDVRDSPEVIRVPAAACIPLCGEHHKAYDARKLSILGLLTFPELMNAARACKKYGINCRRRLTGGRA